MSHHPSFDFHAASHHRVEVQRDVHPLASNGRPSGRVRLRGTDERYRPESAVTVYVCDPALCRRIAVAWARLAVELETAALASGRDAADAAPPLPGELDGLQVLASIQHPKPNGPHPSHETRFSDASTYDEICVKCGAHDDVPGGWGQLAEPCPKADQLPISTPSLTLAMPPDVPTAAPETWVPGHNTDFSDGAPRRAEFAVHVQGRDRPLLIAADSLSEAERFARADGYLVHVSATAERVRPSELLDMPVARCCGRLAFDCDCPAGEGGAR